MSCVFVLLKQLQMTCIIQYSFSPYSCFKEMLYVVVTSFKYIVTDAQA